MKKLLSFILIFVMMLTVLPTSIFTFTASAAKSGYYTYTVSNEKATITGCDVSISGDITIPDTLGGYPVTSIGDFAFSFCVNLRCITIPDSVTSIGINVFEYCLSLTDINVSQNNGTYRSVDGVLFDKSGETLICCPAGKSGDYSIPDSVTSIGDSAFRYCGSLTSVTIPDSVTSIGDYEFSCCDSLTSITIGDNVTFIGVGAFSNCDSLTSITIPDSVTGIGDDTFTYCRSLTSVIIGDNVTSIGSYTFTHCGSLTSITIPDSVTSIGYFAFYDCESLTSITIPDSVTSIPNSAFYDTGYYKDSKNWENDVLYIGNHLMEAKDTISGEYAVKSGTKVIAYSAFSSCDSLTSITIPGSVTSIGDFAFFDCYSLIGIEVSQNNNMYKSIDGVLFDKDAKTLICCPSGKEGSYSIPNSVTSIESSAFSDCYSLTSITIPDSVTSIGDWAFSDCESLTSIIIPDSVTNIGEYAFSWCESLTNVTIGNSVISIGDYAFSDCYSLTSIIIPDSVTSIADYVFCGCESLTSIAIPDTVTSVGDSAFYNCSALQDVYYGGSKYGWAEISIGDDNDDLLNATIHYAKPNPKPSTPENLTATLYGYDDVRLSWDAVEGANRYYVSYKKSSELSSTKAYIVTGNSYKFSNLADNTNYDFSVIAVADDAGEMISSDPATIRLKTSCPLGKVSTFTATLYGHDDVELNWGAVAGATGYKVYYKKASAKNYTYLTTTPARTYSIANLTDNCKYNFKIVPVATYGSSTTNGTAKVVTYSTAKDLAAPKTLKASLYGYDDAKLTWSAVSGASRYKIYYKQSSADTYKYKTYTTKTSYNFANLYDGVSYDFKIVPCSYVNGTHFEDNSYKTVTISSTINLTAPQTVTAKLYGYDDVDISWSAVENADAYKVYYKKSSSKTYTLKTTTTALSTKIWNLSDGIKYDFKIVPCTYVNGGYYADDSAKTASIYTLKKISTPTVTKHKAGKVKITWGNIQGESGYEISRSTSKTGTYIVSDLVTTTKNAVIVSATKGKTYYYKVRAYKIVDGVKIYSPWSSVKSYKLK